MSWVQELELTASVVPHFVLTGNTWDYVITRGDDPVRAVPMIGLLHDQAAALGLDFLVVADPVRGFELAVLNPDREQTLSQLPRELSSLRAYQPGQVSLGSGEVSAQRLAATLAAVAAAPALGGLVVADAGRWIVDIRALGADEHSLFTLASAAARASVLRRARDGRELYSLVWWLCRSDYELPAWYLADPCVRTVNVPSPERSDRQRLGDVLVGEERAGELADASEAMSVRDLLAVGRMVEAGAAIPAATTLVRLGVIDDPWADPNLLKRLHTGLSQLRARVLGQEPALQSGWTSITRSLEGLSGIQRPSSGRRPRIVLFLAGPTGVGKTELAKAMAKLLFGSDRALIRFDMSGYTAEHSDQRLIGAPPGYVGYEAGGELTNALRTHPFSVILFDEIEKAHPRILDKFLQILDEGHIDDGLGRRVYFDQSVVMFTSNIGITEQIALNDGTVRTIQNVDSSMSFSDMEKLVRDGVKRHFVQKLGRIELLNRIGDDNVVVFDFIRPAAAAEIFDQLLVHVASGLFERREIRLSVEPHARAALQAACCADLELGGRGISNKVESLFLNPLSGWLFEHGGQALTSLRVKAWSCDGYPRMEIDHD